MSMAGLAKDQELPGTLEIIESMVQTREGRMSMKEGEKCEIHGSGLNFYSSKEQGFKCLSCLISKEDVQYVDKSYISSLEKYNEIRLRTEQAINTNEDAASDVARWKDDIRDMVMRVRAKYISFIDSFALQLKQNILDI